MKNKWLFAAILCTLLGILAGIGYLTYVGSFANTNVILEHTNDPSGRLMLQFFGFMLGLSLLLNLFALFEVEQLAGRMFRWLQAGRASQVKQQFLSDLQIFYIINNYKLCRSTHNVICNWMKRIINANWSVLMTRASSR